MKDTHKQRLIKMKRFGWGLLLPLLLMSGLLLQLSRTTLAVGTATYSLSPSSGSYANGSSLTVTVHENSGTDAINAVEADLTYDQTKLQFVSADTSTGAFDNGLNPTGGSGSVKFSRAKNNTTLTGDQIVGTVTFTAIAGSGTTNISFAGTSEIIRQSDSTNIWDGTTTGGSYTLTGASSGSSGSSGTGTTTPTSTTSTTKTTTTTTPTKTTTPSSATAPASTPTSPAVTTATSPAGYYVAIKVVDSKKKPVKGAIVTIAGQKPLTTDGTGLASFISVPAGKYTITASAENKKATSPITVIVGSTAAVQQFSVSLPINKTAIPWTLLIAVLAGLLLVIAAIIVINRVRHHHSDHNLDNYSQRPKKVDPTTPPTEPAAISPSTGIVAKPPEGGELPDQVIHPDPAVKSINDDLKL